MARPRKHVPLRVFSNSRLVGLLVRQPGGGIAFRYDESWIFWKDAVPVSLSLPLREDSYRGEAVSAVFENLLPDSDQLRRKVAERTGASGTDAYSLLTQIGRDCVGALQFIPEDDEHFHPSAGISGKVMDDAEIERLLKNLARAPLGLDEDQDFRISVAGAQEKTALLWHSNKWWKPNRATPTSHIFKVQIGTLQNGLDLSNSVENEYYCLRFLAALGLAVNNAEIKIFGKTKALVLERFDRTWTKDGQLLRVPQEDLCQALSCPPSRKYQNQGGPGIVDILKLLNGGDTPIEDQKTFLKAQIVFWLIGATDGHAKNFSSFLGPGGSFKLTPIYDVLTAQPSVDTRRVERKQMKPAMSVGNSRHYRIDEIDGRHFIQTAERAGLAASLAVDSLLEVARAVPTALTRIERELPADFPRNIHASVTKAVESRLSRIKGWTG